MFPFESFLTPKQSAVAWLIAAALAFVVDLIRFWIVLRTLQWIGLL